MDQLLRLLLLLFLTLVTQIWSIQSNSKSEAIVELITYEVKSYVSGIRVINLPNQNGLITYSEAGASIIYPETRVRIALFGYHLDKIGVISLTTDNCFNSAINVSHPEFLIQTVKRLDFIAYFAESDAPYHVCYKERVSSKESSEMEEEDMIMMDESRNSIITETPSQIYYLPIYLQTAIIAVLFCHSALFSGLNLGLMALSPQELMLIQKSGSKTERGYAETILPVRQSGNYLLCTILIMNVVINAAISILFEDLTSGIAAFVISSVGIVVIGEIIPQSICVKKGLAVGAYTIWFTRTFMILTFPLSYPISKLLDAFLGEDSPVYDRCKLINLMKMATCEENQELADDIKIAVGAMEIGEKTVGDVMTKIGDVFMLPETAVLDSATIAEIIQRGYSRIPIHADDDRYNIKSLLMVKNLALIDPRDNFTVKNVCEFNHYPLRFVEDQEPLHSMLDEFKNGDYHLAMVKSSVHTKFNRKLSKQTKELLGIVTLEDIVEEILQAEIVDESDAITDNLYRSRRKYHKEPNFAKILVNEEYSKPLSVQIETITIQWLRTNYSIFSNFFVDQKALVHLLKRNVKQVNLLHLPRAMGYSSSKRESLFLLRQNKPAVRFILILEGRAIVKIQNMEFETGPWTAFGTEILEQIDEFISGNSMHGSSDGGLSESQALLINTIQHTPDYDLEVTESCRFLQLTPQTYLNAYKVTRIARAAREKNGSLTSLLKTPVCSMNNSPHGRRVSEALFVKHGAMLSFDSSHERREMDEKRRTKSDYGKHLQ